MDAGRAQERNEEAVPKEVDVANKAARVELRSKILNLVRTNSRRKMQVMVLGWRVFHMVTMYPAIVILELIGCFHPLEIDMKV